MRNVYSMACYLVNKIQRLQPKKWQKLNSSETKTQHFEAVDYICADEPNGLVGVTGLLFDADKLKRSINAALSMRAEANVVTRRYGLRQQVLYLMYYGEE